MLDLPRVLVTGAGGFIGSHLVRYLKERGYWVRGVDIKRPVWSKIEADEFLLYDLRDEQNALAATRHVDWVFHLAANMGGIGFISQYHAEIVGDNTAINHNAIRSAYRNGVKRFLFSSSACVYPVYRQEVANAPPLREDEALPALPEGAYGWEKLHMEHLCKYYHEAGWLDTRVVRFHNVYGPHTDWDGPRAKAPAALCRKVAVAKLTGDPEVEIWGDGLQRRSFLHIGDCLEGLNRLMHSDYHKPINLGRDRSVSVDELVDIITGIAGIEVVKNHIEGWQGVRGRNSNNDLAKEALGWSPQIPVEQGMVSLYEWVEFLVEEATG
jgi:nucleoside-diphosphate-sugar epimerase